MVCEHFKINVSVVDILIYFKVIDLFKIEKNIVAIELD